MLYGAGAGAQRVHTFSAMRKKLKPRVLINPDRNHTEAVTIVTATENNTISF